MTDHTKKNFYELLGVSTEATQEQIKIAYRDIARVYHPDSKFYAEIIDTPITPRDEEIFKLITAAYDTLMDSEKKAIYDRTLLKGVPSWSDDEKPREAPVSKPILKPDPRQHRQRPAPAGASEGQFASRTTFGGLKREDYVSMSSVQRARPVADLLQSTRRGIMEHILLFIGLGLPLLTLAAVAIYMFWFAPKM